MKFNTKVQVALVAIATLAPLAAFAAGSLTDPCSIAQLVSQFVRVFAFIVFVLAIAAILYSGFLFLTAGGNEAKVESARSALIWGLIGIAVALFASYAISFVANSFVGGQDIADCNWTAKIR